MVSAGRGGVGLAGLGVGLVRNLIRANTDRLSSRLFVARIVEFSSRLSRCLS